MTLKVGQLRRWTIPKHPTFGKHGADGLVFRVVSVDNDDDGMATGEYVVGRTPTCHAPTKWMTDNSTVVEDVL